MKQKTIHTENPSIGYLGETDVKVVTGRINVGIGCGEPICLLGANGVEKPTLLRTLSVLQPKLGGKTETVGKEVDAYTDKELSTAINVVLTERCNIRNVTVHELVGLGQSPYTGFWGTLRGEDREVVECSVTPVKIGDLTHRMVHTLNDGERQKAMVARALIQETPVIFLDELTTFLDFPSKAEMMQLLHQLGRQISKMILFSAHDLELALQIIDKTWLMDEVNGVTIGTPKDLSLSDKLSNFFAHKGVVLDLETGLSRVDNEYTSRIRLVRHGQKYAMVRKALQRNGVLANRNIKSDTYIETGDLKEGDGFIVYLQEGEVMAVGSIRELLKELG